MDQLRIHRLWDAAIFPDADMSPGSSGFFGDQSGAFGFDDGCVSLHGGTLREVTWLNQGEITPGYVQIGNVLFMDDRWRTLSEPHDRLRWARIQWQESKGIKPEAQAAADSLGIKPHTYRAYERPLDSSKATRLDDQRAIQFGRKFGVNWIWLLTGKGTPDAPEESLSPAERQVIDALREAPEARRTAVADAITQLLKIA